MEGNEDPGITHPNTLQNNYQLRFTRILELPPPCSWAGNLYWRGKENQLKSSASTQQLTLSRGTKSKTTPSYVRCLSPLRAPPPPSTFQIWKSRDLSNLFLALSRMFIQHSSLQNRSTESCSRSTQHVRWYWWKESAPERKIGCWGQYEQS